MPNVHIEINYIGWQSDITRKGNFPINIYKFKQNGDRTAAEVALNWINKIRNEEHIGEILKVTYNKDHDITELVKDLDNKIYDDLPF